ncbi:ABC transporter ATP-binding protein [Blastochloris sulfoviridis]|uniref:ATP-binding cassette domain-containing protein n=1 Tax=Blastochloris sulfoviridis TaxID=50712 RepID=A0A5M6HV06_9HYPH|nr:ATP-binding cassette domain-containing protein [Blastochloris sulfoviridis]KAA5599478.1 ATP-binding cassette domain-containing protein [Blastochloris sulfoviridis]
MAPVIQAETLRKTYRIRQQRPGLGHALRALVRPDWIERAALDGISFNIEQGAIAGLMGANGAGKSTLIKLLVGIMPRDGGTLTVAGLDPFRQRRHYVQRIGVVFGQRSNLLWDLSVVESFELHRAVFGVTRADYERRLAELTELFELGELLHQPARTLSLGQTMRCAVAQVLLQQPDILFLDEPTIGLDVVSVERLGQALKRLNAAFDTTIVITSHDLAVIEDICTQVILLEDGRILFDGTAHAAVERYGRYRRLRFVFPPGADIEAAATFLQGRGVAVTIDGPELCGVVDAEAGMVGICAALVDEMTRRHALAEFFVEKPSLKEVILHAYR